MAQILATAEQVQTGAAIKAGKKPSVAAPAITTK